MHRRTVCLSILLLIASAPSARTQTAFHDDLGREVTLPSPPQRIVSLAPSITETLFAIGAGGLVAGVTDFCNFPPEALQKPKVGGLVNTSVETIVRLDPDLVIMSMEGNTREDFATLVNLGIHVFVTNPRSLDGIAKSIVDLGGLTGREQTAQQLVTVMKRRRDEVQSSVRSRIRVLFLVSVQPLIAVGERSFLSEIIALAGGDNIAFGSHQTYPAMSREAILEGAPECILLTSGLPSGPDELLSLFPEWKSLPAIQENAIAVLDADIVSRPGPRAIDALDQIARALRKGSPR
jgi:iron complex transport system substrate-binding protein